MTNLFTPREWVQTIEEVSGKQIKLKEISFEEFDKVAGWPGMHELWAKWVLFVCMRHVLLTAPVPFFNSLTIVVGLVCTIPACVSTIYTPGFFL